MAMIPYDELGLFHENAAEYGLPYPPAPTVRRERVVVDTATGRAVSALVWGEGRPRLVLLHGGAQNAHTWDTTLMALGEPAIAIDLPGHGHSDWRDDGAYTPTSMAVDIAAAISELAAAPVRLVGMSLGGLTAMEVTASRPELVSSLAMIDITPGVNRAKTKAVTDFVGGPQSFPSFESLLERTVDHNPTRSESSLRRGILHNARQLPDGSWEWRYDRRAHARANDDAVVEPSADETAAALSPLWDRFGQIMSPMLLVRGSLSPVVDDDDVAEARRRQPRLRVEVVDGAGHSVQGDRPLELATLLATL